MAYTKHQWEPLEKITADRLNNIEDGIEAAQNDVDDAKSGLDDVNDEVDDMKDDISRIKTRLTAVEGTVGTAMGKANEVDAEVDDLKSAFSNYEEYGIGVIDSADSITWTNNYYINDNGEISAYNGLKYSSLIHVNGDISNVVINVVTTGTMIRVHAYDSNGDWISMLYKKAPSTAGTLKLELDTTGASYIRVSMPNGNSVVFAGNYRTITEAVEENKTKIDKIGEEVFFITGSKSEPVLDYIKSVHIKTPTETTAYISKIVQSTAQKDKVEIVVNNKTITLNLNRGSGTTAQTYHRTDFATGTIIDVEYIQANADNAFGTYSQGEVQISKECIELYTPFYTNVNDTDVSESETFFDLITFAEMTVYDYDKDVFIASISFGSSGYSILLNDADGNQTTKLASSETISANTEYTLKVDQTNSFLRDCVIRVKTGDTVPTISMAVGSKLRVNNAIIKREYYALLPEKLYMVSNVKQRIYANNAPYYDKGDCRLSVNIGSVIDNFAYDVETQSSNFNVYFSYNIINKGENHVGRRRKVPMEVVTSDPSVTKKVLVIGDSKTWSGYKLAELSRLFTTCAANIELVGKIVKNGTASDGSSYDATCEARPGWSVAKYYNSASYNGYTNLFYNPSTELFDFRYYMTQNGFSGVDYVVIDLGANDIGAEKDTWLSQMSYIVTSIHEYDNNIKIVLCMQESSSFDMMCAQQSQARFIRQTTNINKWILDGFSDRSYVFFNPQYLYVDMYYDFPKTTQAVDFINPTEVARVSDNLHLTKYGYYKIARTYFAIIRWLMAQS